MNRVRKCAVFCAMVLTAVCMNGCGPGPQGLQGPKGDKGDPGKPGVGITYEIGFVGSWTLPATGSKGETLKVAYPNGFLREAGQYLTASEKTGVTIRIQFSSGINDPDTTRSWQIPSDLNVTITYSYLKERYSKVLKMDSPLLASKGEGMYEISFKSFKEIWGTTKTLDEILDNLSIKVSARVYTSGAKYHTMKIVWYWVTPDAESTP